MTSGIVKKVDIDEVYITFDIENLEKCANRQDIKNLFVDNNPIKNISIEEFNYVKLSVQ